MEKKIQCFKCRDTFEDPKELFNHIKLVHRVCGKSRYTCTLCAGIFTQFGAFKTHVLRCFNEMNVENEVSVAEQNQLIEAYNEVFMEHEDVTNFRKLVEKAALKMSCKLSAIMILPRELVYEILTGFEKFLQNVIHDGMNKIIMPRIIASDKETVREFMNVIESSFSRFTTEWKFDNELYRNALIAPIERCAMFTGVEDVESVEDCGEVDEIVNEEGETILMPLTFQIQRFLELPGVFQKIRDNTENIKRQGKLNHFINGSLWKEKMTHYNEDQIVIPYHYYSDGAQLNHPLGPHCRKGLEDFHYYSFPTVPAEYQSRLENIFLLQLFPDMHTNKFGTEKIYGNAIEELTKFAKEGIFIKIDSMTYNVFLVCGLFLADTKEANISLGFQKSPKALKYCRYCQIHSKDLKNASTENPAIRRNRQNYTEDVLKCDPTATGVREYSILNTIPYFHVTDSSAEDVTHTVELGIGKYNISEALEFLIFYEEPICTFDELNKRLHDFNYGEHGKGNKPQLILEDHLDKHTLKMNAAETANFIHNLTFIIGDLVPEDNIVWQFILNTVRFFDYSYLPCYEEEDIENWSELIEEMNNSYIAIFGTHLKPHHHFATHFPTDTKKFGPLRGTRTLRFEGKHRELKGYTKNSNNRTSLSFSIARKVQYNFADRLLQSRGLEDVIEAKYIPGTITEKVYYTKLKSSLLKDRLEQRKCYFTDKITVNGIKINRSMWLPDVPDDGNRKICKIHEIYDIVLLDPKNYYQFFAICKTYETRQNEHYVGYEVDVSSLYSELEIINIGDFLRHHHYPVNTHKIGEKLMFRCKRF